MSVVEDAKRFSSYLESKGECLSICMQAYDDLANHVSWEKDFTTNFSVGATLEYVARGGGSLLLRTRFGLLSRSILRLSDKEDLIRFARAYANPINSVVDIGEPHFVLPDVARSTAPFTTGTAPKFWIRLLTWLLPAHIAEERIGTLIELYETSIQPNHSLVYSQIWIAVQSVLIAVSYWVTRIPFGLADWFLGALLLALLGSLMQDMI